MMPAPIADLQLLAQRIPQNDLLRFFKESAWAWVVLVILLVLLFGSVFWIKAKMKEEEVRTDAGELMVSRMAEMHRRGEITEEEYRSIVGEVAARASRAGKSTSETPPPAEESPQKAETMTDVIEQTPGRGVAK